MTRSLTLAALALSLTVTASAQTPDAVQDPEMLQRYQATITPSELAGHLYVYADDYLAGRDTGEPGQRFAAKYLAGEYAAMGIAPKGTGTASNYGLAPYLQEFNLERKTLASMSYSATRDGENVLSGGAPAAEDAMIEIIPVFGTPGTDTEPAPVVWVGDASAMDGVSVEGAYVIAAVADQAAMQSTSTRLVEMGARGVILPAAPAAAMLQGMAGRLMRSQLSLANPDGESGGAIYITGMDVLCISAWLATAAITYAPSTLRPSISDASPTQRTGTG